MCETLGASRDSSFYATILFPSPTPEADRMAVREEAGRGREVRRARRCVKKPVLLLQSLRSSSRPSFLWIFDDIQSDGSGTTPPGRRALTLRLSLDYGREHPTSSS